MTKNEHLESLEKLSDNAIDVAEQLISSHETFRMSDVLDDFDIELKATECEDLMSRCHSVITEEIYKFVKERLEIVNNTEESKYDDDFNDEPTDNDYEYDPDFDPDPNDNDDED